MTEVGPPRIGHEILLNEKRAVTSSDSEYHCHATKGADGNRIEPSRRLVIAVDQQRHYRASDEPG